MWNVVARNWRVGNEIHSSLLQRVIEAVQYAIIEGLNVLTLYFFPYILYFRISDCLIIWATGPKTGSVIGFIITNEINFPRNQSQTLNYFGNRIQSQNMFILASYLLHHFDINRNNFHVTVIRQYHHFVWLCAHLCLYIVTIRVRTNLSKSDN